MSAGWNEAPSGGALEGVKILDLSRVLAGPYATQILGDHGADVLKVEAPGGDETRRWGPPFIGDTSAYFMGINRNKRGVVLDLNEPTARDTLAALMAGADVLIENFKKGGLDKWGFSGERLEQEFPHLIHCRITGYGDEGPSGGLPAYDAALQAMSGMMSINGETGGRPLRVGVPVCDLVTGLNAVIGILMALQERSRSGKGQRVDVSLLDSGLSMLHPHSANFLATGKLPGLTGNAHPNITPYDTYETATGPIFLTVGSDRQFAKLCEVIGVTEVAQDDRFANNASRCAHRSELKVLLEQALAKFEVLPLADQLNRAGVPCAPVLDMAQAFSHPQTQHNNMVWEQGGYRSVGAPVHLSRTPASLRKPPPALEE
jgi:crotonobetainyl-CoA:carnitine CoA-transferase CaiB-like acyl-CoA transferase